MTTTRMSAREVAAKFLTLKSASSKKKLIEEAQSRCTGKNASKKARWERLAKAMAANDLDAVRRYADFAAWSAAQKAASEKPKAKAKPASKAKPAARKTAKPKASPAASQPDVRKVAESLGIDPDLMAAFVASVGG